MKINRLLEISIILLNRRSTTAKELANRFDVSTRTIYRDIDVLSTAGVPVYTNKGKGGGIFLLEDYCIGSTAMTSDEYDSLKVALELLKATKYPDIDLVMDKLGGLFKSNKRSTSWIEIDINPWGSGASDSSKFNQIKSAVLNKNVIKFDYYNSFGSITKREVEPLQLWFKGRGWYLWAYCRIKEGLRLYRITRIKNLIVTNNIFTLRDLKKEKDSPKKSIDDNRHIVSVKLKFTPKALYRMYDDFDIDDVELLEDGSGLASFHFPEDEWVYTYLLSFGTDAEVVEPEHIRKILHKRGMDIAKLYS